MAIDDSPPPSSNPLPPPPPRSFNPLAPERDGGKQGMSQDDFRKLLATPRARPDDGGGKKRDSLGKAAPKVRYKGDEEGDSYKYKQRPRPTSKTSRGEEKEQERKSKYRDRAAERRDNANPDYVESEQELAQLQPGGFHSVPPPQQTVMDPVLANISNTKLSIEKSKYLGGDLEHTHLVKGLDYALLAKIRTEIQTKEAADKKSDRMTDTLSLDNMTFLNPMARSLHRVLLDRQNLLTGVNKSVVEMFLPRRMAFVFDLDPDFPQDIPTTLIRSKADCPQVEEKVPAKVDHTILAKVERVMGFIKQGAGGKHGKKLKKKEKVPEFGRDGIVKMVGEIKLTVPKSFMRDDTDRDRGKDKDKDKDREKEREKPKFDKGRSENGSITSNGAMAPPPPPPPPRVPVPKVVDDEIYPDVGSDYVPTIPKARKKEEEQTPSRPDSYFGNSKSQEIQEEIMEEDDDRLKSALSFAQSYAGNAKSDDEDQADEDGAEHGNRQAQTADQGGYSMPPAQGLQLDSISQVEKDRGLASVFKRDPNALRRETDKREMDPTFVSDSYAECYPGFHETLSTFVHEPDSDEEDLTKMDLGKNKKGPKRWEFDSEEQWAAYNETKEAMPRAAFQFGVKMADGRKTRRNKDQKLNSELKQIERIIEKRKGGGSEDVGGGGKRGGGEDLDDGDYEDEPRKRSRKSGLL